MDNLDPSTLTDEELDRALAGEPITEEPEAEVPEPVAEPTPTAPEEEPVVEEVVAEPELDGEPEPAPPSRREQLRINQLLDRMKQPQARPEAKPNVDTLNYQDTLDADPEVLQALEEDRKRTSEQYYNQGLQQAQSIEWRTMLHIETPQVETEYKQMNPKDKENFNPVLTETINNWYLQTSGFDPESGVAANTGVRYKDFVDGLFELADEIATTKVASTRKNVAKQAANTGLRPDGSSAKSLNLNQAPQDMTDEELDAYLGQAFQKR